jgi:membrane dipeptidase
MDSKGQTVDANTLHRDATIVDAHSDILMDVRMRRRGGAFKEAETRTLARHHLPRLRAGGLDAVILALFAEPHIREATLRECLLMIDDLHQEIEESPGAIRLVCSARDLDGAEEDERLAALLSLEGTEALAGDIGILRLMYDLGLRAVGLTWFGRTMAADGTGEEEAGGGLTHFGKEVIRECNRLGILVDVSHLSQRGFWEVLELARGPIIASHSNTRVLCDHPRNLTDEQLRAVAATGGCVGLNAYRGFVDTENPSLERLLDHAVHMTEVMGRGHVGLGLDLVEYLPGGQDTSATGLADASELPALTAALLARGTSEDEAREILGENWLRVWRAVLP